MQSLSSRHHLTDGETEDHIQPAEEKGAVGGSRLAEGTDEIADIGAEKGEQIEEDQPSKKRRKDRSTKGQARTTSSSKQKPTTSTSAPSAATPAHTPASPAPAPAPAPTPAHAVPITLRLSEETTQVSTHNKPTLLSR